MVSREWSWGKLLLRDESALALGAMAPAIADDATSSGRVDPTAGNPVPLMLKTFGGCKHLSIDRDRTDDGVSLAHRFADGVEEGSTGVLHRMPMMDWARV